MPRLKTADNPNGFLISIVVNPTDHAWLLGGERLRKAYFKELAEQALRIKQAEILRGLDKDGRRFAKLSRRTIEHRRSAMGYADPYAPPLIPAHEQSRTYAYLRYEVRPQGIWFFWRHDPRTGGSWGDILRHHATGAATGKVRDAFGISPSGMAKLEHVMEAWYAANTPRFISRFHREVIRANRGRRLVAAGGDPIGLLLDVLGTANINDRQQPADPVRVRTVHVERVSVTPGHLVTSSGRPTTLRGFRQKRLLK